MIISPLFLGAQENPVTAGLASANPAGTPEQAAEKIDCTREGTSLSTGS